MLQIAAPSFAFSNVKTMYRILWIFLAVLLFVAENSSIRAQGPPWNNPLRCARSADGKTFGASSVFQDSAGVPSVLRLRGDTLLAVFQWFREPRLGPTWDRVAAKFSFDAGISWTSPEPIVIENFPSSLQRPFDPTVVLLSNDSLRLFFSSSDGMPMAGDSIINTYSAVSADGLHYRFESGARVDVSTRRVIDPAVVRFGPGWHFIAPIGAPQEGAYHFVSPDCYTFTPVATVPSDNTHNWTGNFCPVSASELRFYGSGPTIWYSSSPNGGEWSPYVSTNLYGGDPSAVLLPDSSFFIVYVGQPYSTDIAPTDVNDLPTYHFDEGSLTVTFSDRTLRSVTFHIYNALGQCVASQVCNATHNTIPLPSLPAGLYFVCVDGSVAWSFSP